VITGRMTEDVASANVLLYAYAMRAKRVRERLRDRVAFLKENPEALTEDDLDALRHADGRLRRRLMDAHDSIRERYEQHLESPEVMQGSFHEFVKRAFRHTKYPGEFRDGWHIRALCREWEGVYNGETMRILINQPPSSMKSALANVFFPAWCWSQDPGFRLVQYSYNDDLPQRDGRDLATLVNSDWYRRNFPQVRLIQESASMLMTSVGGFRIGQGWNGTATGLHPNLIVIDDPTKAGDIYNRPAEVSKLVSWFASTISSRGIILKCAIAIVMQRLATSDLCGAILNEAAFGGEDQAEELQKELDADADWRHVCLPMFYDPNHRYLYEHDKRTQEGEILWPEVMTHADIQTRMKIMEMDPENGGKTTAAQMNQDPLAVQGALFEGLREADILPTDLPRKIRHGRFVRAWDLAESLQGDYTAGVLIADYDDRFYILDAIRFKKGPTDRNRLIVEIAKQDAEKFDTYMVAAEKSGNAGKEVFENLHALLAREGIRAAAMPAGNKSKTHRATPIASGVKYGEVRVLRSMKEYNALSGEMRLFPGGRNDDLVDAAAMAYQRLYDWRAGKKI